jgi:hypothetical protein
MIKMVILVIITRITKIRLSHEQGAAMVSFSVFRMIKMVILVIITRITKIRLSHEQGAAMVSFSDETEPSVKGQLDKIKESNSPPPCLAT